VYKVWGLLPATGRTHSGDVDPLSQEVTELESSSAMEPRKQCKEVVEAKKPSFSQSRSTPSNGELSRIMSLMKRITYTSFLIPVDKVDDTSAVDASVYAFCKEVQGVEGWATAAEIVINAS